MAGESSFTQDKADLICEQLLDGKSLRQIVKLPEINISPSTICFWLQKFPEFAEQYARVKEMQAEMLADEIIAIADQATSNENAQAIRVRVDSRKWVASKLLAKKYGDKVQHANESGDGPATFVVKSILEKE